MNTASRTQHLVPALCILALSIGVTWLSYTREPAGAFLFPRLISTVMLLLAIWNAARAALGLARAGSGVTRAELLAVLPGAAVMLVYVLFAARALGFYVASFIAFILLYALYDPAPHDRPASWGRRVFVACVFMLVIYGLFTLLLKVQTPRGAFF